MSELLNGWKRSGMCADFDTAHVGQEVTLMGWVQRRRNLGGLIFVWLRDRSGIIQVVFDENRDAASFEKAESLRSEFVIAVKGKIAKRDEQNINRDLKTGEIEVEVSELKILSSAATPPTQAPPCALRRSVAACQPAGNGAAATRRHSPCAPYNGRTAPLPLSPNARLP